MKGKMANKFHNHSIWIVPGNAHLFRSEHDAKYYCQQHGIDFSTVEKYDSTREYDRWLELRESEKNGKITNLRRQVEYEIIPNQYDYVLKRTKPITDHFVDDGNRHVYCKSMKTARDYCKAHGLKNSCITKHERQENVYKPVLAERKMIYTADFVYDEDGRTIVEDVKSEITRRERDYIITRKLMRYLLRINIREIL